MKKRILASALAALLFCGAAYAGDYVSDSLGIRFDAYTSWCSPEKIYAHIDRTCYTAGENIWFKGWIADASVNSQMPLSNFIYAELLDEKGVAQSRVKIKRKGDGFPGCLDIPESAETGNYTFRAYSLWQLNGDPEYMFNQTVRVIGGDKKTKKERKSQQSTKLNISFWPEGGRYFAARKAIVGFKVQDYRGRSVDKFNGFIADSEGTVVMPVSVRHDGMGAFEFLPVPGRQYFLEDFSGARYPLPEASEQGATINLRLIKGYYYMNVCGFGEGEARLLVRDLNEIRALTTFHLDGRPVTIKAESEFFRAGINHLLVVKGDGSILAERLFYVYNTAVPQCSFTSSRFVSDERAANRFAIRLKSAEGTPLDGSCSVSVVRGTLKDWQQADGIESYIMLSSELKGHLNEPYYYFDPSVPFSERSANMDLLMMIHGWRYYDLDKIFKPGSGKFQLKHLKELAQTVRGRITRRISSRMPKKFNFTLIISKLHFYTSLDVDQANKFVIDSLDFEENTEFLINIGTARFGATYLPKWDGDVLAPGYLYVPAPGFGKDVRAPLLSDSVTDTLQAAVVVADAGDGPDVLTFGSNLSADISQYKNYTLVEYISMKKASFSYDGENMINQSARVGGFGSFSGQSGEEDEDSPGMTLEDDMEKPGAVKLIVDETEEAWWGYDMIHMGDLKSISISTMPDPRFGGSGGVVAISLKPGAGPVRAERDPSLLYFVPLGHQVPRYFDSPRYDRGEQANPGSDKRNTVWWSPSVAIKSGYAGVTFCNTDRQDYPYIVRIEGVTSSGIPFSHHCEISPNS